MRRSRSFEHCTVLPSVPRPAAASHPSTGPSGTSGEPQDGAPARSVVWGHPRPRPFDEAQDKQRGAAPRALPVSSAVGAGPCACPVGWGGAFPGITAAPTGDPTPPRAATGGRPYGSASAPRRPRIRARRGHSRRGRPPCLPGRVGLPLIGPIPNLRKSASSADNLRDRQGAPLAGSPLSNPEVCRQAS